MKADSYETPDTPVSERGPTNKPDTSAGQGFLGTSVEFQRQSSWLSHSPGALLILTYALFLFWPIPFADFTIASGDILDQFYPWTEFWVRELRAGAFPFWNPYTYGGSPLLGNLQVAPFYPPQFLLPLISPLRFFGWTLLLHIVLAGLAMYLLIFHLTKNQISATALGLVYMSSGLLVPHLSAGHLTIVNGLPWVPLVALFYLRWADRPSWGRWTLMTTTLAIQLLGGQPQIPYLTLLIVGVIALRDGWIRYRRKQHTMDVLLLPAGAVLLAGCAAVLLTAVAWLPAYSYYQVSAPRSEGLTFEHATQNALPPIHLISFLLPFFYGDPTGEGFWGQMMTGYYEICGFTGLGTLILGAFGLWRSRFPRKSLWAAVALVSLLLALGANIPYLYRFVFWFVPGLQFFRIPGRFLLLYIISICVLAGYGLAGWLDARQRRPITLAVGVLAVLMLVCLMWTFASESRCFSILARFPIPTLRLSPDGSSPKIQDVVQNRYHDLLKAQAIGLVFLLAWLGWLFLAGPLSRRKLLYGILAISLTLTELGWFASRFIQPRKTAEVLATEYPQTATVRFLQEHAKLTRILMPDETIGYLHHKKYAEIFPNRSMHSDLQIVRGYDVVFPEAYGRFFYVMRNRPRKTVFSVPLRVEELGELNRSLLSALNVHYLLLSEPLSLPDFEPAFEGDPLVYTYQRAFPRAYVLPPDQSIPAELPESATVEMTTYNPNEIQLQAVLSHPGWLVVADNDYAEWKAEVNGQPAPIEPVLGTFRGIQLAPGRYQVRMRFDPVSLRRGALISLSTLLCLAAMNIFQRRRSPGEASPN